MLTTRRKGSYLHLELLDAKDWGLVIYDEVHLLPAPIFRLTASLQARRRLGLTATLVREDGREDEVFSLIGPKQYEVPWKELERLGYIASAACHEVRVRLDGGTRTAYARADGEDRYRLAATSDAKLPIVSELVADHPGAQILVIGQYLDQLEEIGADLGAPVLTGHTPESQRQELFREFRSGDIPVLVVSKVANFSVDLPAASVAIQVSGSLRLTAGGGSAARTDPAPEGRSGFGDVLDRGRRRHRRRTLRRPAPPLPHRAGLQLQHRGPADRRTYTRPASTPELLRRWPSNLAQGCWAVVG